MAQPTAVPSLSFDTQRQPSSPSSGSAGQKKRCQSVYVSAGDASLTIGLKSYLQPFEYQLAELEFEGLGLSNWNDNWAKFVERANRLSYFDVVSFQFDVALQPCAVALTEVLRESAASWRPDVASKMANRRVLRFGPHGFHEYRGKFFPQLVRSLCNASALRPGNIVLDPMCGSGTTLVEARALDLAAYGIDRNPLSRLIAHVKTDAIGWSGPALARAHKALDNLQTDSVREFPWPQEDVEYLRRWFHLSALRDVAGLLKAVRAIDDPAVREFGLLCLSNIVRRVSIQKEDELRVRKIQKPYSSGDAQRLFRSEVLRNLEPMERLLHVDGGHEEQYHVRTGDAKQIELIFPSLKGRVDAIITSPPYATALPYIDTDRLSLVILGLLGREQHRIIEAEMIGTREISEKDRQAIWQRYVAERNQLPKSILQVIDRLASNYHDGTVGFRRRNLPALLARYFLEMRQVMSSMYASLRPHGRAFVVVGTNSTTVHGKRFNIDTDLMLTDIARDVGFEAEAPINMELLPSRDPFKLNRGTREQILRLAKA